VQTKKTDGEPKPIGKRENELKRKFNNNIIKKKSR